MSWLGEWSGDGGAGLEIVTDVELLPTRRDIFSHAHPELGWSAASGTLFPEEKDATPCLAMAIMSFFYHGSMVLSPSPHSPSSVLSSPPHE